MEQKKRQGFACQDEETRKAVAARGGRNVPAGKRNFSINRESAVMAGRAGGKANHAKRSFEINPILAKEAGVKGGKASQEAQRKRREQAAG